MRWLDNIFIYDFQLIWGYSNLYAISYEFLKLMRRMFTLPYNTVRFFQILSQMAYLFWVISILEDCQQNFEQKKTNLTIIRALGEKLWIFDVALEICLIFYDF